LNERVIVAWTLVIVLLNELVTAPKASLVALEGVVVVVAVEEEVAVVVMVVVVVGVVFSAATVERGYLSVECPGTYSPWLHWSSPRQHRRARVQMMTHHRTCNPCCARLTHPTSRCRC